LIDKTAFFSAPILTSSQQPPSCAHTPALQPHDHQLQQLFVPPDLLLAWTLFLQDKDPLSQLHHDHKQQQQQLLLLLQKCFSLLFLLHECCIGT
jgi:hypothetical protein